MKVPLWDDVTWHSEQDWTAPRDHCPDPDRWSSTDQDATEVEVSKLVASFVTALHPDVVVETGTNIGITTYFVCRALAEQGYGKLITFETDPNFVEIAEDRCAGYDTAGFVEFRNHHSLDWDPVAEGVSIDLAFFDSLVHLRAEECEKYLPAMHNRTVVAFHDTGPQHPTRDYVEELVRQELISEPLYLPTPRGICFSRVTAYGPVT